MEISFVVPNSSNGSRAASAEDSGIYDQGTAEEYKVSNVTLYLFDSSSKNLVTTINVAHYGSAQKAFSGPIPKSRCGSLEGRAESLPYGLSQELTLPAAHGGRRGIGFPFCPLAGRLSFSRLAPWSRHYRKEVHQSSFTACPYILLTHLHQEKEESS